MIFISVLPDIDAIALQYELGTLGLSTGRYKTNAESRTIFMYLKKFI